MGESRAGKRDERATEHGRYGGCGGFATTVTLAIKYPTALYFAHLYFHKPESKPKRSLWIR